MRMTDHATASWWAIRCAPAYTRAARRIVFDGLVKAFKAGRERE
jgi:hypothetical protein